jgi:hypothetical protein
MARDRTLLALIKEIVLRETIFLRHYIGKVINADDPENFGRVKCEILALGWTEEQNIPWMNPRDKRSRIVPKRGEYVEVYFMEGRRDRPVYLGITAEIKDMIPDEWTGDLNKDLLYNDYDNKILVQFDKGENELKIGKSDFLESARKTDAIQAVIPAGTVLVGADHAVFNPTDIILDGEITEGSSQVKVGDK